MFAKRMPGNLATPSKPKAAPPPTSAVAPPAAPKPTNKPVTKSKASKDKIEQFNTLKMRLHRKLIDQLDLTLMTGDDDALRTQVK